MRDLLAERLLAEVMSWTPEDVASERPALQAMATYKYDEYQQFSPGMRFVESLALWLEQFKDNEDKALAYQFVKSRMIFFSAAETAHIVSIAYPDFIRPKLLQRAAKELSIHSKYLNKIYKSKEFRALQRRSICLGLSDGAHIDIFRRSNQSELSHEQILQTYDISSDKASDVLDNLIKDLTNILRGSPKLQDQYFNTVILLDDFSGSGITYKRKIEKFYKGITDPNTSLSKLFNLKDIHIIIVVYIATKTARTYLENNIKEILPAGVNWSIEVVQPLLDHISLNSVETPNYLKIVNKYYDSDVEDEHFRKGGQADAKLGFGKCALPLVLNHNTPNNSVFLLWAYTNLSVRGLFPRVSRHRSLM